MAHLKRPLGPKHYMCLCKEGHIFLERHINHYYRSTIHRCEMQADRFDCRLVHKTLVVYQL